MRQTAAPHDLVLKDYALSYVLAAIFSASPLAAVLAFKGGTALRKCFFRGYRFSEDLDFTLLEKLEEQQLEAALQQAAVTASDLTRPYGIFRFAVERTEHRENHPFGQIDFKFKVWYPTGATLPIKVEVTRDEPLVFPTTQRKLIHLFDGEPLSSRIQCYGLPEIALEKLRAFLQARQNLEKRDWVNRSRDLYDLWFLWHQHEYKIDWAGLRVPLNEKARARNVTFKGPDDFRDSRVMEAYRRQWQSRLSGFVSELPPFDQALDSFDKILSALFDRP